MNEVNDFLYCSTPQAWIDAVVADLPTLLIDHANCEKKAASTALNLIFRYVDKPELSMKLSKLAREELRHFEQVLTLLQKRNIDFEHVSASRYAAELRKGVRTSEPHRLVDMMIVSAIVEARSCERFEAVIPVLDEELAQFYTSLLKSEARHFQVYLNFAKKYSPEDIQPRVDFFLARDRELVESNDTEFRFHSGSPVKTA
ncbi:tRNA-(ms[2]io[6]A)-hydroxylase [Pseudomonadales bacterium]|jgi:tRNA-(ms[2]io[6]A)-hydroxylase|nr:tRNA-(ms[2]io[6]A)-hydroxylase [Gammaproteobacteria bacterium]MBT3733499.1 tRNA-(ms[2]io[6]A)-hydroxylase [Gammaproteobacteria bacterium]MBT7539489.1 tRNA-(ms[2]io[6]A)-hydroxylase [Gammaproteobacteria bacterium]MDA7833493.1 tRNA-(ms[2]io[6]A)-hydroxylase [Pseudomonadales bacterium]MDC1480596.1 tRNA-(ms[2]io[6]A)-hydroxylase [Pseudomonadales bacterium]|tara:strand:- start:6428 stop:7030 length:603 start_codon:yes stop_codon:yes gene_type:complete